MQMQPSHLFLSLVFTFWLFHLGCSRISQANDENYISQRCNTTFYPELCYTSLAPYARDIQQSLHRLIRVSFVVCHTKFVPLNAYISNLTRDADPHDSRLHEALDQCSQVLGHALEDLVEALDEMRNFKSGVDASGINVRISAVLDDPQTCIDGFEEIVPDGPVKSDVINRMNEVAKYVSISLRFVKELEDENGTG